MNWDVILYVEDDDTYAQVLHYVLEQAGFKHRLVHVSSAYEAQDYLEGRGKYCNRSEYPFPGLILADLKMPEMNGIELLRWVRHDSRHKLAPFVILTSSDDLRDVNQAYQYGANSFLIKPPTVAELTEMMRAVDNYWIKHNVPTK